MKTLADYIMAVQIEEGTDLHAQAEAHLSKANDADAKGDNYGYHMHMTNHHEALSQWHDSKGRGGLAAKHEDLAAKHEDKAEDAREASSKRGVKEAYGGLRGNVGDRSKREFKHRELEHELGHEVNPRATFSRPSSSDVPHAVHIDGKKWKTFGSQSHATNVARKIPGATVHKEEYVTEGSHSESDEELENFLDSTKPELDRLYKLAKTSKKAKAAYYKLKEKWDAANSKLYGLDEQGMAEGMNDWALKDKPKAKSIPQTSGMNNWARKDVHNKAYEYPPTHYDKDGKDMYGRKKPELKSQTEGMAEAKVVGHVSDVAGHGKVVQCAKCDTDLRDDHGFALDNGTYICRSGDKCSMRQAKNRQAAMAARGEKPRWRKDEGVTEEYAVKHKETGKTLSTHDNEASAKDEYEGLGDDKSKYKVIKTSSAGKQFKMHEGN